MDTIIGLGAAGCRIADKFAEYPQYDTYKIDVGLKGDNCFALQPCLNPEDYEKRVPDMSDFFKDISGDVLFVVGGGGKISGTSLQLMKQLKDCSLNVLYIKPYSKSLTKMGLLQDRTTFYVLQEYARSGIFKNIILAGNTELEQIVGDVPILEYNSKLNEIIVNAIHYLNVFQHSEPVIENMEPYKESQRISTIGILNMSDGSDTLFYPLENIGYKCYYYAIPEQMLKTDNKLFKSIKEKVSVDQSSYQVFTTKHKDPFSYFVARTSFIQTLET
jgi:hypothetical protein